MFSHPSEVCMNYYSHLKISMQFSFILFIAFGLSLIGFYSIPFLFSFIEDLKNFIKKYIIVYLISLLILIILFYSLNIDILALNEKRDYSLLLA